MLCNDLAYQIVRDGEGATKVFHVDRPRRQDSNARPTGSVKRGGRFSPLVKTAVHGGDPNWGRIVTAAGYSGAALDPRKLSLHIGPKQAICVFDSGEPTTLTKSTAARLERLMQTPEVVFTLTVGLGTAETEWLGCDLSREYITINADYTT